MSDTDQFSDQEIVAKTLWGESRGEGHDGQQAVANVIMNRANSPRWWGNDARSVCLKPYQFSCWNENDPNRAKLMAITTDDSIYGQCLSIAGDALSGALSDLTLGSDSYCTLSSSPNWSEGLSPVITIGNHKFYKTI